MTIKRNMVYAGLPMLLLSACGSGGGVASTPTPTPAPTASYTKLDDISTSQTYDAATVDVPSFRGTPETGVTYKAGTGLKMVYDPTAGTYSVTAPSGYSVVLSQQRVDSGISPGVRANFSARTQGGAVTDSVNLFHLSVGGVRLSYATYGRWLHMDNRTNILLQRTVHFVEGAQTQNGDLPKSGTATYSTFVSGGIMSDNTTYVLGNINTGESRSSASASINFGAGTVNTALTLVGASGETGVTRSFGTFSGSGTLDAGGPSFSGTFGGAGAGDFAGSLFGPQGKEMAYVWRVYGTGFEGAGVVAGLKK